MAPGAPQQCCCVGSGTDCPDRIEIDLANWDANGCQCAQIEGFSDANTWTLQNLNGTYSIDKTSEGSGLCVYLIDIPGDYGIREIWRDNLTCSGSPDQVVAISNLRLWVRLHLANPDATRIALFRVVIGGNRVLNPTLNGGLPVGVPVGPVLPCGAAGSGGTGALNADATGTVRTDV